VKNLRCSDLRLTLPDPFSAVSFSNVYRTIEAKMLLVRLMLSLTDFPSPQINIIETERRALGQVKYFHNRSHGQNLSSPLGEVNPLAPREKKFSNQPEIFTSS
jgi:hypothetical protein